MDSPDHGPDFLGEFLHVGPGGDQIPQHLELLAHLGVLAFQPGVGGGQVGDLPAEELQVLADGRCPCDRRSGSEDPDNPQAAEDDRDRLSKTGMWHVDHALLTFKVCSSPESLLKSVRMERMLKSVFRASPSGSCTVTRSPSCNLGSPTSGMSWSVGFGSFSCASRSCARLSIASGSCRNGLSGISRTCSTP